MATQILAIQPRRLNIVLQTNTDWDDGFPIYQSGAGAILHGASNTGTGTLAVNAVAPDTALGAHFFTITGIAGIPRVTATGPDGSITGQGAVGAMFFAGGLMVTLMPGDVGFAVDDTFSVTVLPSPIDITGIKFDMQVRLTPLSANVALSASSIVPAGSQIPDGATPTIVTGTTDGAAAMNINKSALTRDRFTPGQYGYDMVATDPVSGRTRLAYVGTLKHADGLTFLPGA